MECPAKINFSGFNEPDSFLTTSTYKSSVISLKVLDLL